MLAVLVLEITQQTGQVVLVVSGAGWIDLEIVRGEWRIKQLPLPEPTSPQLWYGQAGARLGLLDVEDLGIELGFDRNPDHQVLYYLGQTGLAVAGLLNLLAILDALARAQTGGLPVFYQELEPETDPEGGGGDG